MRLTFGLSVLRGAGAQFEANLSSAGLHQVLHPLFDDIEALRPPQREALAVALGLGDGPTPIRSWCARGFVVAGDASSKGPLSVVVDDLQWAGRASALVFVRFASTSWHAWVSSQRLAQGRRASSSGSVCAATTTARSTMQPR